MQLGKVIFLNFQDSCITRSNSSLSSVVSIQQAKEFLKLLIKALTDSVKRLLKCSLDAVLMRYK